MPLPPKAKPIKPGQREFEPSTPAGGVSDQKQYGAFQQVIHLGAVTADPSPLPSDNVFRVWNRSDTGLVYGNLNGETEILWPNSRLLDSSATEVDVVSTTTETEIYSGTIAAGLMGTDGAVQLHLFGDARINNATRGLTIKIKLNGTIVLQSNPASFDSVASERYKWSLKILVANTGVTNVQKIGATLQIDQQGTAVNFPLNRDSLSPSIGGQGTGYNTGAADTTAAVTISVTVQWDASSAQLSWRKEMALLERFGGTATAGGGGGGGASLGVPALVFGTTNALGAATTAIGTDATIAIFDATNPANIGTAAPGAAAFAARRDHVHAATLTAITGGNWKLPYTNGSGVVTELALGAASTVLQGNGAAAAPTFTDTPQLAGLKDTAGVTAITINTSTPFVSITSLALTGTGAGLMLAVTPTVTVAGAWTAISIAPALTLTGAASIIGVNGNMNATVNAGVTASTMRGLLFTAAGVNDGTAGTGAITTLTALSVTAKATGTGSTGIFNVTNLAGGMFQLQIARISLGTVNVTTGYGLWVLSPISGGTGKNLTNVYGMYIANQGFTGATIAMGLKVEDCTVGTTKNVFEFGTTTPTTISGVFRMAGAFAAAANQTPLYVSEGATPTVRQLKTFDPGNLGVNFTAGQLVCVLV